MKSDFSINLRIQRKKMNLTQQQMADILGISKSTYCQYESGTRHPKIEMIKQIASYLQISTDELLGNNENGFTDEEIELIHSYRLHHEMQSAIKRLLDMKGED